MKLRPWLALATACFGNVAVAHGNKLPFTVAEEIGLASFAPPEGGAPRIYQSLDGALVAVQVERGLVAENRIEDELRVYDVTQLRRFARGRTAGPVPQPVWVMRISERQTGPIISDVRWLGNSHRIGFLEASQDGKHRLLFVDVEAHRTIPLSLEGQDVTAFDIRDQTHFAYAVHAFDSNPAQASASVVGTGQDLYALIEGLNVSDRKLSGGDRAILWAAHGGAPFEITEPVSRKPLVVYRFGQEALSLSPDGGKIATALPLAETPKTWDQLYGHGPIMLGHGVVGPQDLSSPRGSFYVSQYALIDLASGKITIPISAPIAGSWGWAVSSQIDWSNNGQRLLLPGAFDANHPGAAPCVTLMDLKTESVSCVLGARRPPSDYSDYVADGIVQDVRFDAGNRDRIVLRRYKILTNGRGDLITDILSPMPGGSWQASPDGATTAPPPFALRESVSAPPRFVANDPQTGRDRVVWDPNPQLQGFILGEAATYHWKDATGRNWIGGLYKPPGFTPGHRYPLVIQTHGYSEDAFRPSGQFPTAFAARALAASGIIVLQVRDCSIRQTPDEGPCQVRGYESAVAALTAEGLVDPDQVGIIGFSRTCFYVMEALTHSTLHFKAASITDGVNAGYLQALESIDASHNEDERDAESMIGAPPFGEGLQTWMQRSPEFRTDRVTTPLRVVTLGDWPGLLEMWEPYALLRLQGKPADLILLRSNEHVLTNPAARLAAQGGTVDWFRFWLQGYEDPDPTKAEQYRRWEKLCALQRVQNPRSLCVSQ